MPVNKGTNIRLDEGVQVADRRRWKSAMMSPIGDVGSERVKIFTKCILQLINMDNTHIHIINADKALPHKIL